VFTCAWNRTFCFAPAWFTTRLCDFSRFGFELVLKREKNKELEARNRELEKRLREEQALREAAQVKLRAIKKDGALAAKKKPRTADSPDKAAATGAAVGASDASKSATGAAMTESAAEARKVVNGNVAQKGPEKCAATKSPAVDPSPANHQTTQVATPKTSNAQTNDEAKPKPVQPAAKKPVLKSAESTIAEKNLAEFDGSKLSNIDATSTKPSKPSNVNASKSNQPAVRRGSGDNLPSVDKGTPLTEKLSAPSSPTRGTAKATSSADDASKRILQQSNGATNGAQDHAKGPTAPGNVTSAPDKLPNKGEPPIARTKSTPNPNEVRVNNPPLQRSDTGGPKIASAIEFDPLRSAPPSELNLSLDTGAQTGRNTPLDMQSVSSANATGFQNADGGLGGGFSVQNQYGQQFEMSASLMGQQQINIPIYGLAPANGVMNFQQQSNAFQQPSAMVQLSQQQYSQSLAEAQNGGLAANLSVLQQPFVQVSDQQSCTFCAPH
jgi:hypothetical protein